MTFSVRLAALASVGAAMMNTEQQNKTGEVASGLFRQASHNSDNPIVIPHENAITSKTGEGNAPKVLRKYYNRLDQAERYQNWLYNRHDSVNLIESPRFSEGGFYAWKVS